MSAAPASPGPGFIPGPALRLQGVNLQLGATRILQDMDWQVNAGEIHALVSPMAAAKAA